VLAPAALVSRAGPAGPISGPAARRAAQLELSKAQYHRDDPTVVTRVLDWIGDRLNSVVSGTPSGSATLVLLAILIAVIAFALIRAGRPRRLARRAASIDPLATDATIDHRRLAAEFEAQGRLADALREWLRAVVQTIEERGVLDARPGRTGAAIAREAGSAMPAIRARLDDAVDTFDAVWFGHREATAADVATTRDLADIVRRTRIEGSVLDGGYAVPQ
jgi:Domain of unknown function (DUF4129)